MADPVEMSTVAQSAEEGNANGDMGASLMPPPIKTKLSMEPTELYGIMIVSAVFGLGIGLLTGMLTGISTFLCECPRCNENS